ncbi:GGDEF domain-containing response regulator [Marinomonas agarivorans]|nr:GGDEF domain-containing response regulator [Marinomonas agarivorans]
MSNMDSSIQINDYDVAEHVNVLLVDDDGIDREYIINMLSGNHRHQYDVTVAQNYQDALPLLEEHYFDVCLIDYYLGNHTGLELLKKINSLNSMTSVIMLTGADAEDIDDQALQAGVSNFLSKNTLTSKLLDRSIRYATHHKKLSVEYERLAHYDDLTKLVNRSLFFDRLTHLIKRSQRDKHKHALLYLDLDFFKNINETYGYKIGDLILKMCANRLLQSVRSVDTVARLGGDEFALILENISPKDTQKVIEKIVQAIEKTFTISDIDFEISASIGITFFSDETPQEPGIILEQADQALYQAKKAGRQRHCYFDDQLKKDIGKNRILGQDIRNALQKGEFLPHYQPQYNLQTGDIESFEALARWQRSEQELIYPQQFLDQVEQLKIMPVLTEMILDKACVDLKKLSAINSDIKIAVNISATDSVNDNLLEMVKSVLKKHDIQAQQLELEFDASALIVHPDETMNILDKLNRLGISITINNFGKGNISLWSLAELSIATINIDMSLIHGIGVSLPKEIIVKVILDMAKQFSLKTVAVGVETKEQASFLARYGCDNVQGYLYSRPLSIKDASQLLENYS